MAYIRCPSAQFIETNGRPVCAVPWNVYTNSDMTAKTNSDISTYLSVNGYSPSIAFDVTMIDATIATGLFTAGFILSIVPWATAWGFSQLLRLLR